VGIGYYASGKNIFGHGLTRTYTNLYLLAAVLICFFFIF
jgi:hypothetical protein